MDTDPTSDHRGWASSALTVGLGVSLCLAGSCAGMTPAQVSAKLRNDAAARLASYGFVGDPNNPITGGGPTGKTLYYGYLEYAGGY